MRVVEPIVSAHGAEVVEVEFKPDRGAWVLRLYVEKAGASENKLSTRDAAVDLELCANISRDLSPALDIADLIPHAYHLEVGSPGIERPLRGERDFVRFTGQKAKLKLREITNGQRVVVGTLESVVDGRVRVNEGETARSKCRSHPSTARVWFLSCPHARSPPHITRPTQGERTGRDRQAPEARSPSRGSTEETMAIQQQQPAGDKTLLQAVEDLAKDKGIDKGRLIKTVEEAILKAAQSVFGPDRELEARFNETNGQVDLFQYMTVVDDVADEEREIALEDAQRLGLEAEMGEELGFQIFWHPADAKKAAEQDKDYGDILRVKQARQAFGRIAAQTAKQVLIQRVRDEERDLIFNEFKDRKGELIKGVVRRAREGQQPHRRPRSDRGHSPVPRADAARDVPPTGTASSPT